MTEPRARRGVPERWLLPPAPRESQPARRWRDVGFERRRSLARAGPEDLAGLDPEDAEVVLGLARARLATAWRVHASAVVLGWLVLMTTWGFGRSTAPDDADAWLLAGALLGVATSAVVALRSRRRLTRARALVLPPPAPGPRTDR